MKTNWDIHIKQWQTEKISQAEYCRREGLNYWSFRDQRRKREQTGKPHQDVPTKVHTMVLRNTGSSESLTEWMYEIGVKGYSIRIGKGYRLSDLENLLELLEKRRCF